MPEHDYSAFREVGIGDNLLAQIRAEAQALLDADAKVARLEGDLKQAEDAAKHIREKVLPDLMEKAETNIWTGLDGVAVEIKQVLRAGIPKDNPEAAFKFLEDVNYGDVIKNLIVIEFNRGEEAWAAKFKRDLAQRKKPVRATIKRSVHPQTLLATLRELLAKGTKVPMETFQAIQQRTAFVTVPEGKK